jgi:hypothetical protein
MRVYNMPRKAFEEKGFPLNEARPHHLIIFGTHSEKEDFHFDEYPNRSWEWAVIEILSVGHGKVSLCKAEHGPSEFFFRCDGMTQELIIERFLDRLENKRRKK